LLVRRGQALRRPVRIRRRSHARRNRPTVGERDNLQTGPIIYNGTMWVERNPGAPTIVVFALPGNPRVDRTEYWRRITPSWAAIRWFV
jgi:hypothetical protein